MKWRVTLLLFLAFAARAEALTLSDLLTRTRLYLNDTSAISGRQSFSDAQLTSFLNDGQRDFNTKAWAVITSTVIPLTAGATEYSLPVDLILPVRVLVNFQPVPERTFSFLDDSQTNWTQAIGVPSAYYVRVDSSLVSGVAMQSIGLTPVSTSTSRMDLQYLAAPADLAGASDTPFGATNYRFSIFHEALAYFATYRGLLAKGMLNDALIYKRDYDDLVAAAEVTTRSRVFFNPNLRGNFTQGGQAK